MCTSLLICYYAPWIFNLYCVCYVWSIYLVRARACECCVWTMFAFIKREKMTNIERRIIAKTDTTQIHSRHFSCGLLSSRTLFWLTYSIRSMCVVTIAKIRTKSPWRELGHHHHNNNNTWMCTKNHLAEINRAITHAICVTSRKQIHFSGINDRWRRRPPKRIEKNTAYILFNWFNEWGR